MRDISIIVGLGYGDEGKGSIVDFLARKTETSLVVRYNGGPQASHNVITPEGIHHTFAQFGSGSFTQGSATLLSRYMHVNPSSISIEAALLESKGVTKVYNRLFIDERATIITPWHVSANRIREKARGNYRYGSAGQGVGEAISDRYSGVYIDIGDTRLLHNEVVEILKDIRGHKQSQIRSQFNTDVAGYDSDDLLIKLATRYCELSEKYRIIDDEDIAELFAIPEQIIFEGCHGILLDKNHGWQPHTSQFDCTSKNAEEMIDQHLKTEDRIETIGVTRGYQTRHGAGPMPTETLESSPDEHNVANPWQGEMRVGAFDLIALQYAIKANNGIDSLAVTCIDHIGTGPQMICTEYILGEVVIREMNPLSPEELTEKNIEHRTNIMYGVTPAFLDLLDVDEFLVLLDAIAPLKITSVGPTAISKIDINVGDGQTIHLE